MNSCNSFCYFHRSFWSIVEMLNVSNMSFSGSLGENIIKQVQFMLLDVYLPWDLLTSVQWLLTSLMAPFFKIVKTLLLCVLFFVFLDRILRSASVKFWIGTCIKNKVVEIVLFHYICSCVFLFSWLLICSVDNSFLKLDKSLTGQTTISIAIGL